MKIGTALDEKLFRELKEFSARQGRPLNEIIEEALEKYLRAGSLTREMRIASANKFCSLGFHASVKEIQQLMEEDYYDQ
jgi:metal-responsive CopG/Arc/MetJ family transcriptional regulator